MPDMVGDFTGRIATGQMGDRLQQSLMIARFLKDERLKSAAGAARQYGACFP